MRDKLGFMFYPKDWWTSDTFFDLDPEERYIFLECMFLMYQNGGYLTLTKVQIERRLLTQIKPNIWEKLTQLYTKSDLGYTLESVKKRRTKADTSRENGKLGGRPKQTQEPTETNLKNPPSETKVNKTKVKKEEGKPYRKFAHLSISISDFEKLKKNYSKEQIDTVLDSIENFAKNKKYKSLHLTALNWLKSNDVRTVDKDPLAHLKSDNGSGKLDPDKVMKAHFAELNGLKEEFPHDPNY